MVINNSTVLIKTVLIESFLYFQEEIRTVPPFPLHPSVHNFFNIHFTKILPPGGSEWIISVGDYVDNSFSALGSSDPREVWLEL